jgi:hypothetical protein
VQADWFAVTAAEAGTSLTSLGAIAFGDGSIRQIDGTRLRAFFEKA